MMRTVCTLVLSIIFLSGCVATQGTKRESQKDCDDTSALMADAQQQMLHIETRSKARVQHIFQQNLKPSVFQIKNFHENNFYRRQLDESLKQQILTQRKWPQQQSSSCGEVAQVSKAVKVQIEQYNSLWTAVEHEALLFAQGKRKPAQIDAKKESPNQCQLVHGRQVKTEELCQFTTDCQRLLEGLEDDRVWGIAPEKIKLVCPQSASKESCESDGKWQTLHQLFNLTADQKIIATSEKSEYKNGALKSQVCVRVGEK